uniref:Putative secreted protein n=1 Tax=Anopheles triannulatus TaxID=58253 RepID=A0A2M4B2E6_9DIPT
MDLAVRVGRTVGVLFVLLQIVRCHRDHDRLLLERINVLDDARCHEHLPTVVVVVPILQHVDVVLPEQQAAPFDDQQRSTDTAGIGVDAYLTIANVPNHRYLRHDNVHLATQLPQRCHQLLRVAMDTDPATVDEDFRCIGNRGRGDFLQILHRPLFQELQDRRRLRTDRNVRHQGEILHQPDRSPLGRLRGTDHTPEGVVQLARFGQLAIATDR